MRWKYYSVIRRAVAAHQSTPHHTHAAKVNLVCPATKCDYSIFSFLANAVIVRSTFIRTFVCRFANACVATCRNANLKLDSHNTQKLRCRSRLMRHIALGDEIHFRMRRFDILFPQFEYFRIVGYCASFARRLFDIWGAARPDKPKAAVAVLDERMGESVGTFSTTTKFTVLIAPRYGTECSAFMLHLDMPSHPMQSGYDCINAAHITPCRHPLAIPFNSLFNGRFGNSVHILLLLLLYLILCCVRTLSHVNTIIIINAII